jgi:hypothetical protein
MERLGRIFVSLIMAASMWGCASVPGGNWWQTDTFPAPSLNPPCLAEPLVAAQEKISVQPPSPCYTARAGVFYFRSTPQLADAGQALTRIFYRQLVEKRPFLEAFLIPEPYGSLSEGVEKGRARALDVVVLGEVPYFLDGGGLGKSGLQVNLKVVEVKTGRLLWEITDAVTATQRPIVDLWVTETRPRPTPSIYALAERLAARMCETLKSGSYVAGTARR